MEMDLKISIIISFQTVGLREKQIKVVKEFVRGISSYFTHFICLMSWISIFTPEIGNDVFGVLPTGYGKSLCYGCLPFVSDCNLRSILSIIEPQAKLNSIAIATSSFSYIQKRMTELCNTCGALWWRFNEPQFVWNSIIGAPFFGALWTSHYIACSQTLSFPCVAD